MVRLVRGGLISICVLLVHGAAPALAARLAPSYFDSREVRSTNLEPFPKWTGMLARHLKEMGSRPGDCSETRFNRCHYREWRALIEGLRGQPVAEVLAAVNAHMNRAPYIIDPINWGVKDYWATPSQFFRKDGDCEDYAIAKFVTLKELGLPAEDMRITVLEDQNLKVAHAILVVFVAGEPWVLDNQIQRVVRAGTIRHYRPIFSINESGWWLHKAEAAQGAARQRSRLPVKPK